MRATILVAAALAGAAPSLQAQQATPPRALTLEEALGLAAPASPSLELAKAAVLRARGEQYRARSELYPQLNVSFSFTRLLRSQFEGFSFGGDSDSTGGGESPGTDALPFGQQNTYNVGLSLSQNLFAGGRIAGQTQTANAGRRTAEIGIRAAEAQLTLEVVQAYYGAIAADYQALIAESALAQAESTLKQTEQRRAVGSQPEFDVLRARVARDNQRTNAIARRADQEVAYIQLKQLLNLPVDAPVTLATTLVDTTFGHTPSLARLVGEPVDTAVDRRLAVRQASEAVIAQEGLLKAARSQQLPQLFVTSQYGNVGYPANLDPLSPSYFTNWNVGVGLQFPIFTGGRIKGDKLAAEAGLSEARARQLQAERVARVDARTALASLEAAEAAWESSDGTVREAQRAYEIAELRFREGLSTQTELLDARLALQTAESLRIEAGRILLIARVRVALLEELPLGSVPAAAGQIRQSTTAAPRRQITDPTAIPGMGTTP